MGKDDVFSEEFEAHRARLRAVAYRMLGSFEEADDAVQDAWIRVSKAGTEGVENVGGWLTTIVARVCLNLLRARSLRREDSLEVRAQDLHVVPELGTDPEHEVLLADSVGLALQVVLDLLTPAERLAFVLHDMFDLPFDEIGPLVGRSPAAARQLASRARRRVRGVAADGSAVESGPSREVVDAFFAAARGGSFDALVGLLDPDVVLTADVAAGPAALSTLVSGAAAVAERALLFARPSAVVRPARVNGRLGVVVTVGDRAVSVMTFTVCGGLIVRIDAVIDPERLEALDLTSL